LNNFSALTSIISAFATAPIDRLRRTWDPLTPKVMSVLTSLRDLMSSAKNFSDYREALNHTEPPCIPFFGMHQQYEPYFPPKASCSLPHCLPIRL
jgi:son of sevenless-like protein